MSSADYVPYRFYRLCPADSHTCTARDCLAGSSECPKAEAKPAATPTFVGKPATTGKPCPHGMLYWCTEPPCSPDGSPHMVNP